MDAASKAAYEAALRENGPTILASARKFRHTETGEILGKVSPIHTGPANARRPQAAEISRTSEISSDPPLQSVSTAPDPLRRPMPPAEPYPLACLGEILYPAAKAMLETVQAADAVIAASLLAASSVASMPHADVCIDGRYVPLALWFLSIADSGERKSAVDELATRRHRMTEREAAKKHEEKAREFEIETQAYSVLCKKEGKGKVIGEIKTKIKAVGEPPQEPLLPYLLTADPTIEGLHKLLARGRGYGGVFSDDAGDFLGGHAMNKDNKMRAVASLSKLWDRGEFDRVRGGDGSSKHYGKRVALHLMAQPVIAESVLSDPLLIGQGFLARALLSWPASRAGTRRYVEHDLSIDPAMIKYWQRVDKLLDKDPPLAENTRNELSPAALQLAPDAKRMWVNISNSIESKMNSSEPLASIKAWGSKGADQILRVAGVLALVDDPDIKQVSAETIGRAGEIVAWHLGEAARIIGTACIPPEIRNAEAILAWAHEHMIAETHSGHVLQFGPACVRTTDSLRLAMAVLVRHGYADELDPGTIFDGAPRRTAWRLLPCA